MRDFMYMSYAKKIAFRDWNHDHMRIFLIFARIIGFILFTYLGLIYLNRKINIYFVETNLDANALLTLSI